MKKAPHVPKAGNYLTVSRCPTHREFWAVSVDTHDGEGGGNGVRLTPSKCCGQWDTVRMWRVESVEQLIADIQRQFTPSAPDPAR